MAITKIQSESLNLADTYAFTGTVTGAGGVNTPAFEAILSSDQTLTDNVNTKIAFDTERFDSDGKYDTSNYRFTPTVAGKYFCYLNISHKNNTNAGRSVVPAIYKNGSVLKTGFQYNNDDYGGANWIMTSIGTIIDFNTTDYIEAYTQFDITTGQCVVDYQEGGNFCTYFGAYKIIT